MNKFLFLFAALAMLLSACKSDEPPGITPDEPIVEEIIVKPVPTLTADESDAAAGQKNFHTKFFQAVSLKNPSKNIIVSPLSASMLLSMVANSADNTTASQICYALGCENIESVNSMSKKYIEWISGADEGVTVKMANSIWHKQELTARTDFAKIADQYYSSELIARDFSKGKSLVAEINDWTKRKTSGMIDNIVNSIPSANVAIMVNALYFRGTWRENFNKKATAKATFHGLDHTSTVDMMCRTFHYGCQYTITDDYSAVEIPYGASGNCSMVLILPAEGSDIDSFIASDAFTTQTNLNANAPIALYLPKFSIAPDNTIDLIPLFASLGIDNLDNLQKCNIFTDPVNAQYSIHQKTGINVDEDGTEAASVTWGHLDGDSGETPPEPKIMRFDRPFVFLIKENNTNLCLFAGKINNL